jgi:predicted tellurium resistance membrane protein TerC
LFHHAFTIRDLILVGGGLFLLYKSSKEIHDKTEHDGEASFSAARSFKMAIVQIVLLDLVFSLDSVITAVGMAQRVPIMIAAIIIAVLTMMVFSGPITDFVNRHPSIRMLALAFLLLVGVMLICEGCGKHIDRGYVYFAMAFSLFVEMLNLHDRKRRAAPAHQRHPG